MIGRHFDGRLFSKFLLRRRRTLGRRASVVQCIDVIKRSRKNKDTLKNVENVDKTKRFKSVE